MYYFVRFTQKGTGSARLSRGLLNLEDDRAVCGLIKAVVVRYIAFVALDIVMGLEKSKKIPINTLQNSTSISI